MVFNKKITQNFNIIILTLIYISFSIPSINEDLIPKNTALLVRQLGFFFAILYFSIIYIKKNSKIHDIDFPILIPQTFSKRILIIVWFLFAFTVGISNYINDNSISFGLGFMFFIPFFYYMVIPNIISDSVMVILKSAMYACFFFVLISMILEPDFFTVFLNNSIHGYSGITPNSNNLGLLAFVSSLSSSLLVLDIYLENKKNRIVILYIIIFILSIFVLLLSKSRTPFIALIIAFLFYVLELVKNRKFTFLFFGLFIFAVIYFLFLDDILAKGILSKFQDSLSSDNLLSNRFSIWSTTFKDAKLFGNGQHYFSDYLGYEAHNSIIHYIGTFGYISGTFLAIFLILSSIVSYVYYKRNRTFENFAVMIYIICYFVILQMESIFIVFSIAPTMIFYTFIGKLIFGKNN